MKLSWYRPASVGVSFRIQHSRLLSFYIYVYTYIHVYVWCGSRAIEKPSCSFLTCPEGARHHESTSHTRWEMLDGPWEREDIRRVKWDLPVHDNKQVYYLLTFKYYYYPMRKEEFSFLFFFFMSFRIFQKENFFFFFV